MAYGIGSILGDIDQKADTYRNNPDALAQSYQQNQQLIDLLVLQKLKTDKEAAQRDMQAKMQTPASTIKDQREQQVMGMTRNEVAQQVTPGLQALAQQQQAAQTQGISSLPAPNMQQIGMAEGGIVNFAEAGLVNNAGMDPATMGPENEDLIYGASLARRDEPSAGRPAPTPDPTRSISSITNADNERNIASIAPTRGISSITNADYERNIASMLGEDLNVPKVPTKGIAQAPSTPQSAYAQQLADLRTEQESKLESLIAFLKGAGGQSSFAATMMGGSDAMNAREAGVKAEIMDVLGKLETIDLKERELGQTAEQLRLQGLRDTAAAENDAEQNRIAARAQKAAQAYQEAQAANLSSPALTDQEMRAQTFVDDALEGGSTLSPVALRQNFYNKEVTDAQKVALARLGINDEQSRQDLILKVVKAADEAFGNLPNSFSMTPEEQQAWKTAHMTNTYKELEKGSLPRANAVNPVDPNDPAAGFYN